MTTGGTTTPLTAGVALLERAIGYTRGSLQPVTPDALSRPTPCADWDLGRLLHHMNDSLLALHEAVAAGSLDLDPEPRDDCPVETVALLRRRACALLADWSRMEPASDAVSVAGRPMEPTLVAVAGAVEIAVHGWDVDRACGNARAIPESLAGELLDLSPLLVPRGDRAGRFGPPVTVSEDAGAGDRLVAFLGRDPNWRPRRT